MSAASHIQNIAPGPPKEIAATTPARFPIPTLEAVAINKACKPDIESLLSELLGSNTHFIISGNNLNGRNFVFKVKYIPTGMSITTNRLSSTIVSPTFTVISFPHNNPFNESTIFLSEPIKLSNINTPPNFFTL